MIEPTAFWDSIAEKYAKRPITDLEAYQYSLDRTRTYLAPTDHVLELGCGTGSTALLLADSVARYIASDLSPKMIEIGQAKAKTQGIDNVEFIATDVSDAQPAGTVYDTVLALNLLHLLQDLPTRLSEIHGLIKPGGLLISKTVCLPTKGLPLKYRLMKGILPLAQMLGKAPYVNFMTTTKLEQIIAAAGFEILETGSYPVMLPGRYVVARKI